MLFSAEQAFVGGGGGGDEKRASLKTPAWEATSSVVCDVFWSVDVERVKRV